MTVQSPTLSRRRLFAGAAGAGAAAAVVAALPIAPQPQPLAAADVPKPTRGGGYVHGVRAERYYQSTRV